MRAVARGPSPLRLALVTVAALVLVGCPGGHLGDPCRPASSECMAPLYCSSLGHCDYPPVDVPQLDALDVADAPREADAPLDTRDAADARDAPDVYGGFDGDAGDVPDGAAGDADDSGGAAMCGLLAATPLMTTQTGVLPLGASALAAPSCQPATAGLERVYRLDIAGVQGVMLSTDNPATTIDTVLSLRASCDASATEYACNDDNGLRPGSVVRAVLTAGPAYAVVEQFGESARGGTYRLDSRIYTPAPNALCLDALAVSPTSGAAAQTLSDGSGPSAACRPLFNGPQLFYRLTLAPGESRTVTVRPSAGAAWQPVIRVLDTCTAASCAGVAVAPGGGMPASIVVSAPAADAGGSGTAIIAVSATEDPRDAVATFDLTVM